MNKRSNFSKNTPIQATILLYQSSLERKNFVKLTMTQLSYLFIKLTKPFAVTIRLVQDEKQREVSGSYFLMQIVSLCY